MVHLGRSFQFPESQDGGLWQRPKLEIVVDDPIHTFAKLRPLGAVSSFQNRTLDRSEGEQFPKGSVSTFQNPELGWRG